jgi:hypothetical protein
MNLYINDIITILNHPRGCKNNIKNIRNKKAINVVKVVVKKVQKLALLGSLLGTIFSKVVLMISN